MKSSFHLFLLAIIATAFTFQFALAESEIPVPVDPVENKVAPESEKSIKPPAPLVREISPGVFTIGNIKILRKTREITFSAETNTTDPDSVLEFLLVHRNGEKIHESLLRTDIDPQNLNIAFKLLGYKESKELFRILNPNGTRGKDYYSVPAKTRDAARFGIHLTTEHAGEKKTFPASNWVEHRILKKPMPNHAWVYHGSYIHENKYNAQLTGSIFAIFSNYGAIANYSGNGREDDSLWFPAQRVAREGTKVIVTLKPWKE